MEKKALVLDIDGTLTNSQKNITEATKQAIQNEMIKGRKVILASGRPTPGMRRYADELELEKYGGYLLSFNGARIVECKTGDVIFQQLLTPDRIPFFYEFAKKNGCGLIIYQNQDIISAFEPDKYVEIEAKINGLPVRTVPNFVEYVTFDVNKCLMTADPEKAERLEQELKEQYGKELSICRSEPYFIEIMPMNVDKATSLEKMLPLIGVTREETVCCGDGFNDISMIKFAGLGVAMGNAQQVVKEVADYVTGTNDEDGVVQVIQKFFH